jgi:transposase
MADAEAICEAAQRPTMRFVAVKSEQTQGVAVVLRTRDLLIRQRTQTINALRGHLAEFGQVAPQGSSYATKLIAMVEDQQTALPETARISLRFLTATLPQLNDQIRALDAQIVRQAREDETARRSGLLGGSRTEINLCPRVARPPQTYWGHLRSLKIESRFDK